jgi:hypothetical protein
VKKNAIIKATNGQNKIDIIRPIFGIVDKYTSMNINTTKPVPIMNFINLSLVQKLIIE